MAGGGWYAARVSRSFALRCCAFAGALLAVVSVARGAEPSFPPLDGPQGAAVAAQEIAPALAARAAAAHARAAALAEVLAARAPLEAAAPRLADAALDDPAVLAGRLRALDDAGSARLAERRALEATPGGTENLGEALAAAHAAEARADEAERAVLVALRAWLAEAPWATRAAMARTLSPWDRIVDAAEPTDDASTSAAAAAASARVEVREAVRGLRDAFAFGAPPPPVGPALGALRADPADDAALLVVAMLRERVSGEALASLDAALDEAAVAVPALGPGQAGAADVAAGPPRYAEILAARAAASAEATEARASEAATTLDEAERERQDAGTAAAAVTARLIEARVPAEKRVAALTEEADRRAARVDEEAAAVLGEIDALLAASAALRETGRAPEREALVARYEGVPGRLGWLRERARSLGADLAVVQREELEGVRRIESERSRLAEERQALATVADDGVRARRTTALDRWATTLDAEARLLAERTGAVEAARERVLALIPELSEARAEAFPLLPRTVRTADRGRSLVEAADELSLVGPTYVASARTRWQAFVQDIWWWLDLRVLGSLALGSFSLLLGAAIWLFARRYAQGVATWLVRYLERTRRLGALDVAEVRPPIHRVLLTAVDVLGSLLILRFVPENLPELAVALLLLFEVQLLRLEVSIFDLAFARRPANRPAVAALDGAAWRTGRATVFALGIWLAVQRVTLAFAQDLIAGFATEYLVRLAMSAVLVPVIVALLYAWAPHVRRRIAREANEGPVRRFLGERPPTVLLNGPQAVGGLLLLAYFAGRRLVYGLARRGSGSKWASALDILRFGRARSTEGEVPPEPLPAEIERDLLDAFMGDLYVERPKARDAVLRELHEWRDDDRQGLIALLGDAGEGMDAAIAHWRPTWEAEGFTVRRAAMDRRLVSEDDALAWFHRAFDLPRVPRDVEDAAALLDGALEPGVLHIDRLNLAFLRSVGGFDALRTLLEVFHADGVERCWVLAFYRPAWRYLERLGSSVNVHLIRAVVDLAPFTGEQVRELAEGVAARAGHTLDFDELARVGALSGSPEEEREHAVEAYYRLLASSSGGNPSVAIRLWLSCLSPGPRGLRVRVADGLRTGGLPDLPDEHLFVLAALRTHRMLDEGELCRVLNVGLGVVRSLVRQMVSGGILVRDGETVSIALMRLPAVTGLLRRRHFLHWS